MYMALENQNYGDDNQVLIDTDCDIFVELSVHLDVNLCFMYNLSIFKCPCPLRVVYYVFFWIKTDTTIFYIFLFYIHKKCILGHLYIISPINNDWIMTNFNRVSSKIIQLLDV